MHKYFFCDNIKSIFSGQFFNVGYSSKGGNTVIIDDIGFAKLFKEYSYLYQNDNIKTKNFKINLIKFILKNGNIENNQKYNFITIGLEHSYFIENYKEFDEYIQKYGIKYFIYVLTEKYPNNYTYQLIGGQIISNVFEIFLMNPLSIQNGYFIGLFLEDLIKKELGSLEMLLYDTDNISICISDLILLKYHFPNINNIEHLLKFYNLINNNKNFFINQADPICIITKQDPNIIFKDNVTVLIAKFYLHAYIYFFKGITFEEYLKFLKYLTTNTISSKDFYQFCIDIKSFDKKIDIIKQIKNITKN